MWKSEKIEKYQSQIYGDTFEQCFFEIEVPNKSIVTSPRLDVKKTGITMHFLRYGFFPKEAYLNGELTEVSYSSVFEEKPQYTKEDLKKYDNDRPIWTLPNRKVERFKKHNEFITAKTNIENGYVYIVKGYGEDCCILEYKALGTYLYPIYWKDNKEKETYKDRRERKKSTKAVDSVILPLNETYYFAYSRVQLGISYLENITQNQYALEERFSKRVIQEAFKYTETQSEFTNGANSHYLETHALFYNNNTQMGSCSVVNRSSPQLLKSKLTVIGSKEEQQNETVQKLKEEFHNESENRLEDWFITLHDPISCMHDMSDYYTYKLLQFKNFVEKIQYGKVKPETVLKEELGRDNTMIDEIAVYSDGTSTSSSHTSLFSFATLAYQFVYNQNETIEEYSNEIDHKQYRRVSGGDNGDAADGRGALRGGASLQKLEALLGVERRDELKKNLIRMREDTFDMVSSSYLHSVLYDSFGSLDYLFDIRARLFSVLRILFTNIGDIDRHITLKRKVADEGKIQQHISELVDYVIDHNATEAQQRGELKAPRYWKKMIEYNYLKTDDNELYNPFFYALIRPLESVIEGEIDYRKINSLKTNIPITEPAYLFHIANSAVTIVSLLEMSRTRLDNLQTRKGILSANILGERMNLICRGVKANVRIPAVFELSSNNTKFMIRASHRLIKLAESVPFQGVFAVIESINALANLQTLLLTEGNGFNKARQLLEVVKATAGIIVAIEIIEKPIKNSFRYFNISERLAGNAFVIYNSLAAFFAIWDARNLYQSRNKDSAALMLLSAPLLLIAAFSSGVVLGVVLVVAILLQELASFLKESTLQQILHYSLIGSWSEEHKTLTYNLQDYKNEPWQLNTFFRKNVKALTAYEYREDKTEAFQAYSRQVIHDLLFSAVIHMPTKADRHQLSAIYYSYKAISSYDEYPNFEDIAYVGKYFTTHLSRASVHVKREKRLHVQQSPLNWCSQVKLFYRDNFLYPSPESFEVIAAYFINSDSNADKNFHIRLNVLKKEEAESGSVMLQFSLPGDLQWHRKLIVTNPIMRIVFRVKIPEGLSTYNEATFPFANQKGERMFFHTYVNLKYNILVNEEQTYRTSQVSYSQLKKMNLIQDGNS